MSEKNEEVKEIKRDGNKETMQEISDNTRAIEDLQYEYEEKLDEIKKLGYKESFINYDKKDGKEIPLKIVICKEKDIPVGSYTLDDGLELNDSRAMDLLELANNWEKEKEEEQRQRQSNDSNKNNKAEKGEDSEKGEENLPQTQKEEPNQIVEELKKSTGHEYEIIVKISESGQGNSFILSKIRAAQNITGSVYKVLDKSTGEYTLAGKSGKDGNINVVDYKRSSMSLNTSSEHIVGGDSVTEKQQEHANDLMDIGDGISLEITKHELNAVFKNQNGKNDSFKIETEPVSGKSTTKEVEEVKLNHEKVAEVRNLIDQLNIDKEAKERRFKAIMKNGAYIDEDIAKLREEIEEQRNEENAKDEGWGPWDSLNPYKRRPY